MNKQEKSFNTWILILIYTVLFCVLMAGIFALFIKQGRSFLYEGDSLDQGYFWTVEMKHNLESLMSGNGYPLWSWSRGMGLDLKLPIDPFLIISALFPYGKIELGYTVAIVLRLYFAGLAFILFAREVELDGFAALIGSLCYISSTWVINLSLLQGQFVDILILFPILVLSVDRIYKGKSPVLFMLTVGLTVAVNFYLAYMSAIVIMLYIFLRYFTYNDFKLGSYLASIGKFIFYGISGIMISALFVLSTLQLLTGASTGHSDPITAFYDLGYYYSTALRLLSPGYAVSYSQIGIPIFALLVIFAAKKQPSIKDTHGIMALLIFAMTLFPFFGSLFNGFGYITNRWYFLVIFFLIWCAAEHMYLDSLARPRNIIIMLLWWAVLAATTLGFSYYDITGDLSLGEAEFIGGNLAAGFVMILILASGCKIIKSIKARKVLITLSVIGTLVITWNCCLSSHMDYFLEDGKVSDMLSRSTQRAGALIEEDGFYRVDQVDWINSSCKADQPANENLYWQTHTIYLYDSKIPAALSEFNRLLGNNMGYSKRVYVQSNGQRMGLDFLCGVRYFLGNDPSNDKNDSSSYAGYGFSEYKTLDGVEVFENKYDPGIGFTYDAWMTRSEFEKLSRLEREQALLQAVVIPDGSADSVSSGRQLSAGDIETSIKGIDYTVISTDGLEIDGNTFTTTKEDATITLYVEDVENSQMVVSFDNLHRYNAEGEDVGNFYLSCRSGKLKASASNTKNNQTYRGIVDFDLNMGYYDYYSGTLKIHFNKVGTYKFDRLYVSAMDTGLYDKYASLRNAGAIHDEEYSSSSVKGEVDASSDGLMFFSIPVYGNWDVYIDGEKASEIENANIAFFAVPIEKGHHDVELRYDLTIRKISLAITCAGLFLILVASIAHMFIRRRNGNEASQNR